MLPLNRPAWLDPDPLPRLREQITNALGRLRAARTMCEHDPWLSTCVRCDSEEALLGETLDAWSQLAAARKAARDTR